MDDIFLKKAIDLAIDKSSEGKNGPFGAIIVSDGKIVGKGWNKVVELNDPSAHAEIMAIREACRNLNTFILSGCTIYCSCEPCPMCLAAILWSHIEQVVYACSRDDAAHAGFDDKKIYQEIQKKDEKKYMKMIDTVKEYGMIAFEKWISNPNKIVY